MPFRLVPNDAEFFAQVFFTKFFQGTDALFLILYQIPGNLFCGDYSSCQSDIGGEIDGVGAVPSRTAPIAVSVLAAVIASGRVQETPSAIIMLAWVVIDKVADRTQAKPAEVFMVSPLYGVPQPIGRALS